MPTNFPTALDSFNNPSADTAMNAPTVLHHEQHTNVNDAIEAIEAKIGINGSANVNSLDYKINNISSGSVAADAIWDAAGDLAVGSGNNTAVRLARGGANSYLRVNAAGTNLEWGTDLAEVISDQVGTMLTGNTETGITVTYQDSDNTIDFVVGAIATTGITFTNTDRILGRDTASGGAGEEITVGGGIEFTGSGGIQRSALTGDITATAGSNTTAIAAGVIVNADVNASAAIARSKLDFGSGLVNADIATGAAIALSKLATDPLARANHTGTQAASTITGLPVELGFAISDEGTNITNTGNPKLTIRMPHAMTLTSVRASLSTASSSGVVTVDINDGGSTIMTTNKLTIDASEKTSTTAATAHTLTDTALADDAEITFDIDTAGTGARGLKVWLIGTR